MKVRVYPMRVRGRRLPWREVKNGPSYVGRLVSYGVRRGEDTFKAITLEQGSPAQKSALPDLYEPVLLRFAPNAFQLRGYEQVDSADGPVGVVQEWHCVEP